MPIKVHIPIDVQLAARQVPRAEKENMFDAAKALFSEEAAVLVASLKAGEIGLGAFEQAMQELIKMIHTAAYVAGRGAQWDEMTRSGWQRVERTVADQYRYLRNWVRQLSQSVDLPGALENVSVEALAARANMYAEAAGMSLAMGIAANVGLDLSALPAWPRDGSTPCLVNCKCRWSITILSIERGHYRVTWRLGNSEHCVTCLRRARAWRGLMIRGNRLVSGYEPIFN